VHSPNHYFLLEQILIGDEAPLEMPLVRGADGLYTGRVSVFGLNNSSFVAKVVDLGMYPWGALPSGASDDIKACVSSLTILCKYLGIDTKSGSMNRCAVMHVLAACFLGNVLAVESLCPTLGQAAADPVLDHLPLHVQDCLEEVLTEHEAGAPVASVLVPELNKRVSKASIIREFNETRGVGRLSADRVVRYGEQRSDVAAAASLQAVLAQATHTVKLFDDVSVKFQYTDGKIGNEFGRVVRMRKKAGSKWIEYVRPVDLNDREAVKGLYIVCYYYRAIAGPGSTRYLYDTSWNTGVDVRTIIAPVVVTFHADAGNFSIAAEDLELARQAVLGLTQVE
jgi:hypothetical protein